MRNVKYAYWALLGLFMVALLAVTISEVISFDVFWQLQSGKYMWQTKSFIRADTFTLASDVPRIEHTWLHSLALYATYSLAGYQGISVLKGLLLTLTCLCLVGAARVRQSSWPAIFLILPLFLLTYGAWLERPQLWTFLIFALFLLVLQKFYQHQNWTVLWLFPLSVFWANVHAGSVLAVAIVAAYLVGGLGDRYLLGINRSFSLHKLLTSSVLVALASFVNPYPGYLLKTLLNVSKLGGSTDASGNYTVSMAQKFNIDWTLTTFNNEPLFFYIMAGSVLIVLLGWRRISLVELFLLGGLAMMGMKLARHIPFFYMGAIAILPRYLDGIAELFTHKLPLLVTRFSLVCILVLTSSLLSYQLYHLKLAKGLFSVGLREWHYPIEATDFIREHKLAPNIYNTYDWGGYIAWQLFPEYQVFWDGRQISAEMFRLGFEVMTAQPDWEQILDRFGVQTIITRASTFDTGQKFAFLNKLKSHRDWHLVFNSESSMVFVKEGSVPASWVRRFALPKARMADTVLAEAQLMVMANPGRYMAWWEMAQIYLQRHQYQYAFAAVKQHLRRAPRPAEGSEQAYRMLSAKFRQK